MAGGTASRMGMSHEGGVNEPHRSEASRSLAGALTLLVALCLLTSAATAYAECAWVLWVNEWFDASLDRAPSDVRAFATRSDCLAAMEQTAQTFKGTMGSEAGIGRDTRSGSGSLSVVGKGHSVTIRCLPDTVDPRGAKGNR